MSSKIFRNEVNNKDAYAERPANKRLMEDGQSYKFGEKRLKESNDLLAVHTVTSDNHGNRLDDSLQSAISSSLNHGNRLDDSLQSAISSSLNHLPSFWKNNSSDSLSKDCKSKEMINCVICKCCNVQLLYKAKCCHLFCKRCLTKDNSDCLKCSVDETVFLKKDVIKVHLL